MDDVVAAGTGACAALSLASSRVRRQFETPDIETEAQEAERQ